MSEKVVQGGDFYVVSSTGAIAGVPTNGTVIGVLCSSSSSGTLTLAETGGTSPRNICTTMSLSAGQFYPMPANYLGGLTATIGGTASVTVFVQ